MRETALIMRNFSSSCQSPHPRLNQIQLLIRISIHSTRKKQDLNLYLLISFQKFIIRQDIQSPNPASQLAQPKLRYSISKEKQLS